MKGLNWKVYVAILVVAIILILLLNSLNVVVFSGAWRVGFAPTIVLWQTKLWVMLLIPLLIGLAVGMLLGIRVGRGQAPRVPPVR